MKLFSPYDSSYLKYVDTKNLINNITKYIITDFEYIKTKQHRKIKPFVGNITLNPVILYGISRTEEEIETFNHPLLNINEKWIAFDARVFVKPNKENLSYDVKNDNEYDLNLQRFILSGIWATGQTSSLYALKFPHNAFSSWISDNLTKRFMLDLNDQVRIKLICYFYYAHLFVEEFTVDDYEKLIIRLKEEIFPIELIEEVYEKTKGNYNSLEGFCKACYLGTSNIKLNGFSVPVLLNLVINNWMSINGKEFSTLALEHPPTWISLVYASLKLRNFSKNYISTIVERINKKGKGDEFLKQYVYLTRSYLEE